MAATVSEIGIGRSVIATVPYDDAKVIRFARVPSAAVGGYILYRSKSRTGWSGISTDDDGGYEQVATLAQPGATSPFSTISDPSPPASTDLYYRVRAVDNTSSPSEFGDWSNLAAWHWTQGEQRAVPTFPDELRPSHRILRGMISELQDAVAADGPTWYELWLLQASVMDRIENELVHRVGPGELLRILLDPPQTLRDWFSNAVAAEFAPLSELHPDQQRGAQEAAWELAERARRELLEDPILRLPGSGSASAPRSHRLTRG